MAGTNLFAEKTSAIDVALNDEDGNAFLVKCAVGYIPSAQTGYAEGCILATTDSGALYMNTGSATSCTFTLNGTGASGYSGASGTSGTSGKSA